MVFWYNELQRPLEWGTNPFLSRPRWSPYSVASAQWVDVEEGENPFALEEFECGNFTWSQRQPMSHGRNRELGGGKTFDDSTKYTGSGRHLAVSQSFVQ